ncbi:hypothetical protein ILUMI_02070 [Ignelater luminosus]|uniref:Uncharacterized protein n=1 Tax=Ignelater luminosus TaxID=2038154 RepID=A0A8K0DIZ1_IGNLU|nr:hypothetical protein ILUMI_02070 [Ignelater luminosus]
MYRVVAVTLLIAYSAYPILDNKPLPSPFPFDLGKYTTLMYCFQVIGGSFSTVNNICFDITCASLMGLAAAQLDILAEKIICIEEDEVPDDAAVKHQAILGQVGERINEKLRDCVKHHIAIIE